MPLQANNFGENLRRHCPGIDISVPFDQVFKNLCSNMTDNTKCYPIEHVLN